MPTLLPLTWYETQDKRNRLHEKRRQYLFTLAVTSVMVETTGMLLAAMSEWFSDTLPWRRVTGTIHGECTCNYLPHLARNDNNESPLRCNR